MNAPETMFILPSAFEAAILALAIWRITSLITYERGPGHVFERIRTLANIRHNEKGHPEVWPDTFPGELLSCVWCLSPYVALALFVLYYSFGSVVVWACLPLALSAGAIVINRFAR